MNKFLEELRSLDESAKTKVLVIATLIIMAIVIYFWLGYFNSVISSAPAEPVAAGNQEPAGTPPPSAFQNLSNGFAAVAHSFGQWFQASHTYNINPQ